MAEIATDLESLKRFVQSFENDNFEIFVRDDEVYTVVNNAHEDPSAHMYNVFTSESGGSVSAIKCTCPHHEHRGADCKHMDAVEDLLETQLEKRQEWMDWQEYQKQHREELLEEHQQKNEGLEAAKKCVEVHKEMKEDAEWDSMEEWRELKEQATKAILSADEWRQMSSEGRARYVAFL